MFSQKCDKLEAKPFDAIPGPRPSIPFIGTSWLYFNHIGRYDIFKLHEANVDKYNRYGPVLREEFQWRKPVVLVFEPKDFETVLRYQGKYPIRPPNEFVCHYRNVNKEKYDNVGISNMLGEEWFQMRRVIAPTLVRSAIENCFSSQNEIAKDFVQYLWSNRDGSNIVNNIQEATLLQAIESLSMFFLNTRMLCLSNARTSGDRNKMISATKLLFDAYQQLYYGLPLWKISPMMSKSFKQYSKAEDDLFEVTSKYIKSANFDEDKKKTSGNFLQSLISLKQLSEKDIRITLLDFMAGGIKTMSTTLAFILHHLAVNPSVQRRLQKELDSAFQGSGSLSMDKLESLPYLKACVKEVFRLSSTIPGIVRILPETVVLSGYQVPAGTPIICSFYVTCRLPQFFEDPLIFKPERWLKESRKQIHPYSLLPFGYGTRQCLGRWFSELQLYIIIANVLFKYNLEGMTNDLESIHSFIVVPKDEIKIKITPRN